jgi:hypothetical protein
MIHDLRAVRRSLQTVVEGWFAGTSLPAVPEPSALSPQLLSLLKYNAALNSKAFLVDKVSTCKDNC